MSSENITQRHVNAIDAAISLVEQKWPKHPAHLLRDLAEVARALAARNERRDDSDVTGYRNAPIAENTRGWGYDHDVASQMDDFDL